MSIEEIRKDIEAINKVFGEGTFIFLDEIIVQKVETISTGSLGLDFRLGVGGVPRGRVTEIFGGESTAKSTMCGHICANAQKNGGRAAYIDAEHEVDLAYFKNLGVNIYELGFSQPETMEQALSLTEKLVELNKFDVIIFDSIAALSTQAELEGEINDVQMGDKARLMSKAMRKITPILNKTKTALVFVNQIRDNINKFGHGDTATTPAGRAVKFKAAVRIKLQVIQSEIKIGEKSIGSKIRAKIVKNKLAPPFTEWDFTVIFGKGIVEEYDLLEIAINAGVIEKKGSWFYFEGENIGQGLLGCSAILQENLELKEKIKVATLTSLGMI